MPRPFNAKDTAESLIELMAIRAEIGFARDLSSANLTKMAFLDVDALESNKHRANFGLDLDWNSAMLSVARDASRNEALKRLGQAILQRDGSATFYVKAIETTLDREFEPSSSSAEEQRRKRNIYEKAHIVASQRAKRDLIHLPKPADYEGNESKYEFAVSLMMLQGGSGRNHTSTRLFFNYKAPFHSFLRQLEDATQLCIIPPLRAKFEGPLIKEAMTGILVAKPDLASPEAVVAGEDVQEPVEPRYKRVPSSSSTSSETTSASLTYRSSSDGSATFFDPPDLVMESQKIKVLKKRLRPRTSYATKNPELLFTRDRGYTLRDGPWSYYVMNEASPSSGRIWLRLASEDDYADMLATLRRFVKAWPSDPISATVMHSLDVEAYEESCAQKLLESFDESQSEVPPGWDESLDDVDDDGEGERYMQWLSTHDSA